MGGASSSSSGGIMSGAGSSSGFGGMMGGTSGAGALHAALVTLFFKPEGAADWVEVEVPAGASVARAKELARAKLEMTQPLHALTLHLSLNTDGSVVGHALDSAATVAEALGGVAGRLRIVVRVSGAAAARAAALASSCE